MHFDAKVLVERWRNEYNTVRPHIFCLLKKRNYLKQIKHSKLRNCYHRFNYFFKVVRDNLTGTRVPLMVNIGLTENCNLKCRYCYGMYYQSKKRDFPTDKLFVIFNELLEMGTKQFHLVGGEPLIHKDFEKIIDFLYSKNVYITVVTNGTLVARKIDILRKVDMICFSLDGGQEVNDYNRGGNIFQHIMKGMEAAKKEGIPIRTYTTLVKTNINSIEFLCNLAKGIGFSMVFELPYSPASELPEDLAPTDEELKQALDKIIRFKKRGFPIFGSVRSYEYARDWPVPYQKVHFEEEPDFNYIKCNHGKHHAYLDADGRVYTCAAKVSQKMKVLNACEVGFKKAFEYLQSKPCVTCYHPSLVEYNMFYSLKPSIMVNLIKSNIREFYQSFVRAPK